MSDIRSILRRFTMEPKTKKKTHCTIATVAAVTVATGALILTGEEQNIAHVNITAEAKENLSLKSASIGTASTQLSFQITEKQNQYKELTSTDEEEVEDPDTIMDTIVVHTKSQVQEALQEQKQMLEQGIKNGIAVKKQKDEAASRKKKRLHLNKKEIKTLRKIVEAEAGDQDVMGRMLVANVVMNRVKSKEFPNNIDDVVYQNNGRVYQFSPVQDKRIYHVSISEKTKEAVDRVINGEDKSKGALYFVQRNIANKKALSWFDRDLTKLFTHGCHTFYK